MKQVFVLVAAVLMLNFSSLAWAHGKVLSLEEMDRVKAFKKLVADVDPKPVQQTVKEIEKTGYPQIQLELREAMAKTYVEIVQEQGVQGQKKKEWLYSMIALNMAYLQFGGDKDSAGGTKNLNKLIRQKLKMYLPAEIYHQKGFLTSLG